MKYVTDCIGEEYKYWRDGERIFIPPSDSGSHRAAISSRTGICTAASSAAPD